MTARGADRVALLDEPHRKIGHNIPTDKEDKRLSLTCRVWVSDHTVAHFEEPVERNFKEQTRGPHPLACPLLTVIRPALFVGPAGSRSEFGMANFSPGISYPTSHA